MTNAGVCSMHVVHNVYLFFVTARLRAISVVNFTITWSSMTHAGVCLFTHSTYTILERNHSGNP